MMMKFLTIADPIEKFDPVSETTFFIMKEICRRGHANWVAEMGDLVAENNRVRAAARLVEVFLKGKKFSYQVRREKVLDISKVDVVFLRKDPPVDMEYIHHLTLLELIERSRDTLRQAQGVQTKGHGELVEPCCAIPLFINSPSGIKKANEKIYPFYFPGISPPTVVTSSKSVASEFVKKHKKVVLKPLNEGGGRGVFLLSHGSPKNGKLLKKSTDNFSVHVMLQKYLPQAKKGDKRILLLDGKPLGSFLRVPAPGDFRGNLHSGARLKRCALTKSDLKIIARLKSTLKNDGLVFVGLDRIGPYVTEINVTSPMGIGELNQHSDSLSEKRVLNWIESRLNH